MVAIDDFFPCRFVVTITFFGQSSASQKLVGYALKSRYNHDHRRSARFLDNDLADFSDAIGCGQRRPPKLEDSHNVSRCISTRRADVD